MTLTTKTKAPLVLVAVYKTGPEIVGYAYGKTPAVMARCRRLHANIYPVKAGKVEVPCG